MNEPLGNARELAIEVLNLPRIIKGESARYDYDTAAAEIERYVQARLTALEQGERGVVRYSTACGNCGSCSELHKCKPVDDWCEGYKPADLAPEKGKKE